jgi:hypothetical protein
MIIKVGFLAFSGTGVSLAAATDTGLSRKELSERL